jgi:hypothetical protein
MQPDSSDSILSDLRQVWRCLRLRNSKIRCFWNTVPAKLPTKCYFIKLWLVYNALNNQEILANAVSYFRPRN